MALQIILLLTTLCGIGISAYLVSKRYTRRPLLCPLHQNCEAVTESAYNNVFGIHNDVLGLVFYSFALGAELIAVANVGIADELYVLLSIGFAGSVLFSAYLVYVQVRILKNYCTWCLALSAVTFISFAVLLGLL